MAEKPGRPRVLIRRHVLEIKEDTQEWLEEQIGRVLLVQPVTATLGNPVAFPVLFGFAGLFGGALLLKILYPNVLEAPRHAVEEAAKGIADIIEKNLPQPEPTLDGEEHTADKLWKGIVSLWETIARGQAPLFPAGPRG